MDQKKIEDFIDSSVKLLKSKEDSYKIIQDNCVNLLLNILGNETKGVTISGRIKDADKLREKIYRKNYYGKYEEPDRFIKSLSDGIGLRILCLLKSDEKNIYECLRNYFTFELEYEEKKYFGKKGERLFINFEGQPEKQKNNLNIYRMDALYREDSECVRIEIQIKCLTHYFWGELEHSLFYKNYNYTIGNNFLSSLMKNINAELENLDYEMELLQKHMDKTAENQNSELKEIAALMISKKYKDEVKEILKCDIDLDEVYAFIVDAHFGITKKNEEVLNKFNELISKLNHLGNFVKKFNSLEGCKIKEKVIAEKYKELVKILDRNIKGGDIFWKCVFAIFITLYFPDDYDYSKSLSEMAEKIQSLYSDVVDEADALVSTEMDISAVIDNAFNMIMTDTSKLSYYSFNYELQLIKDVLSQKVRDIQQKVKDIDTNLSDLDCWKNNLKTMETILYISVMCKLREKIGESRWNSIIGIVSINNDYELHLDDESLKFIKQNSDERYESIMMALNQEETNV